MKKAEEILKHYYPQTDKFLKENHPVKYECVIQSMEKYAEKTKDLFTDEDVKEFYYKEHGESHTLDAIPHDEAINLMAESLGLTYKRAWEY